LGSSRGSAENVGCTHLPGDLRLNDLAMLITSDAGTLAESNQVAVLRSTDRTTRQD
jgi:hypothetical protein